MPSLSTYHTLEKGHIDPEEIRRLVAKSKDQGLIKTPGKAEIKKDGTSVVDFDGVNAQWIDIDPGKAAHWLQNNFRNRPISEDVIAAYARDMKNGEWVATHQGIAFNDRDELIDGQHRLHAIIRAGVTIRMMVTFGLPSVIEGKEVTTMDAVDRGRTRSVADQLRIQHGLKNGSAIAAICASIAAICYHAKTRRLSVGQTLEIYRAFQPSIDWAIDFKSTERGLKAKGVLAACAFAIAGSAKLKHACHRLFTGEDLEAGSPLQQLREFLLSDAAVLLNRGSDRGLAELTLQALHLHVAGVPVERLELDQQGLHAFRALQPERVAKIVGVFNLPQ